MYFKYIFLVLILLTVFCSRNFNNPYDSLNMENSSKQDSIIDTTPKINEFQILEAAGNVYFTDYTTISSKSVNITIADAFTKGLDSFHVIDLRKATDFATGHLTGATNMNDTALLAWTGTATITKTV